MANIYGSNGNDKSSSNGWGTLGLFGTEQADNIFGYDGDDHLFGLGGNDWLDGGKGADLMDGGLGDDTYIVDNTGDSLSEHEDGPAGNEQYGGFDKVKSYINYTLEDFFERLELYGSATNGTGNALNNEIVGNALGNTLSGLDGADTLWGMDGEDHLYGGSGMDTLFGGYHNDWLYGGSWEDTLWGESGNDTLDGGYGNDVMFGGRNDDTYIVRESGDTVIEYAGEGRDTVFSNLGDYTLTANVEDLVLEYGVINGTGNALRNQIVGSDDANIILGMGDNDTLYGMGGADTLNGGTGADEMHGGAGNDTYKVDQAGDVVVEENGEGLDTVESTVSYTLTAYVENLVLAGNAANGTGNGLDNKITGNAQDNTLLGGAGADRLYGNEGSDKLNGGSLADALSGGSGTDTFIFDTSLGHGNVDTILDFNVADDQIFLDNAVFTALSLGAGVDIASLHGSEFRKGASALDSDDHIIYNNQTGALLYDSDGSGAAAAVQFASVDVGLNITSADFFVL
ncbi:calcium-binding protein [Bradyrhizobium sp. JYMT SZCCT0428]|uniref:calcium-binding protein n=1 Tax=Bradyrhizobium sp. JYMT SZCCT0428 TaxID=2807673 RepID=UPI001BA5ADC6|nr:calcium-binding protein [Bradyrhizobium sp. JYMT SZCCT0428]MBR1149402.1 calcium-binding protein [Bradyrhizobium sp. JYMT SZCCT0428]